MTDLHTHTRYSDGLLSLPSLIDYYGELGFGAIAITDHLCDRTGLTGKIAQLTGRTLTSDSFQGYMDHITQEAERAWKKYGLRVLPGYEITKNTFSHRRSCHLLIIGTQQYISPENTVEEICFQARSLGALVVAAHPTHTGKWEPQTYFLWDQREHLKNYIDAWEVASGPHYCEKVQTSGLPVVACSDFHHPQHINSWKTIMSGTRTQENIFRRIRQQEISLIRYRKARSYHFNFLPRRGLWGLPVQDSL